MTQTPQPLRAVAAAAAAFITLLASGCGGGGTGAAADAVAGVAGAASAAAADAAAPAASAASAVAVAAPVTISGVAATGAPFAGATITVTDSTGAKVCSTTTAADGHYGCEIAPAARAPFAVVAELDERKLYSTVASAAGGVANVTQLTTLIVARMTPGGDPAAFAQAIHADPTVCTAAKLKDRTSEVRALIAPLLGAVGDTTDPVQGKFVADGSGHDKALDALQVSIRPSDVASNIEVTVKTKPGSDAAEPVKLSFKSDDRSPAPLQAAITKEDLVADSVPALLEGLQARFAACYAEPLARRIAGVAAGAVQGNGGATAVASPACRALFVDDDPSKFLDNGLSIGSSGAFSGLFKDSATGAKFDRFAFEYQWASGDIYVTFRSLTKAGAVAASAITVRRQGAQLKVVGNQYRYEAAVRPFASVRESIAQPHLNYIASGYGVSLPNKLDAQTQLPIFKEAVVTAPDGRKSLYRPLAGRSNLGIVEAGGRQRSNSVQFYAARFVDSKTTGTPQARDGKDNSYFVEQPLDDDAMRALPDHGSWRIEWVHADTAKPNVVQTYRTLRRAPTLPELSRIRFAGLSDAMRADLLALARATGTSGVRFGAVSSERPNVFEMSPAAGGDGWTVPEGAGEPTSVAVYGVSVDGQPFNNTTAVAAGVRKATVRCASQSALDRHCDTSTGVTQFAEGARITNLELYLRDSTQLEIQRQVTLGLLPD